MDPTWQQMIAMWNASRVPPEFSDDAGDFAEQVLDVVSRIPRGKVMSYGDIAEYLDTRSARAVAKVLSQQGNSVPWHRVIRSDGRPASQIAIRQLALLEADGVPIRAGRVVMATARWDGC